MSNFLEAYTDVVYGALVFRRLDAHPAESDDPEAYLERPLTGDGSFMARSLADYYQGMFQLLALMGLGSTRFVSSQAKCARQSMSAVFPDLDDFHLSPVLNPINTSFLEDRRLSAGMKISRRIAQMLEHEKIENAWNKHHIDRFRDILVEGRGRQHFIFGHEPNLSFLAHSFGVDRAVLGLSPGHGYVFLFDGVFNVKMAKRIFPAPLISFVPED